MGSEALIKAVKQQETLDRLSDQIQPDVLLVRCEGEVCAIAHTCSHLGGPLSNVTSDNRR